MPERFDAMIRDVLERGVPAHHEVSPEEFGPPQGRLGLFRDCLRVLVRRYPAVRIVLSGSRAALLEMGLAPGADILIDAQFVTAVVGPTDRDACLRLTFSRRI